jgi:hypothetical protein
MIGSDSREREEFFFVRWKLKTNSFNFHPYLEYVSPVFTLMTRFTEQHTEA